MTPTTGSEGLRIARGALAQQAAQVVGVVSMLASVTVLGRTLPLDSFGVYGLVLAIAAYVLVVQASVGGAVVRAVSTAADDGRRDRVFSTALAVYSVVGVIAGVLVATGGTAILDLLDIPVRLRDDAREGMVALGCVMALGWPFKVFQDGLRGTQRFLEASLAEVLAHVTYATALISLTLADAPLWAIAAVGGSLPVLMGAASAVAVTLRRVPLRFRREDVDAGVARELIRFSGRLGTIAVTDLIVYALDRVILAAFRNAATVGLYEAVTRPHNLLRQLHSTLVVTVVPVASGYLAAEDEARMRDLLVRGTRYVLAIVVPVTVIFAVLAAPILDVWLGAKFRVAAPAMAIFAGYWVLGANTGVGSSALVAAGQLRAITVYAWVGALLNLTMSLALTPRLGLEGVVIATAAQTVLQFPWFIALMVRYLPVSVSELARRAWLPAYATGAVIAVGLGALLLTIGLESPLALVTASTGAMVFAAAAYWMVWLDDHERTLVRRLLAR